ncbi:MAG: polysaccharide deacetylase family protein [Candidatus Hydrogenedentales bacterium]
MYIFRSLVLSALFGVVATFAAHAADPTYAERLGWPEDTKALIIHNDDAGMSYDSNRGTIRAIEEGVCNSFSVMMPCPWVPGMVKWIKENPNHDGGLHLTMTAEWDDYRWGPLAGKPTVPGLTDEEGCLWDNVPLVVQNASPDEVEQEIRAQLDRARTMGFEPTHLDSHMGTLFATPAFLERYIKVGVEEGIPVMFPGGHGYFITQQESRLESMRKPMGEQIWKSGLPVLDDLHNVTYDWKTTDKTDLYIDAIKNLKPGVTMMILHATDTTEVFDDISSSGVVRQGDLNAMIDPRLKQAIEEEGIVLTTFRELKQRRDQVKE